LTQHDNYIKLCFKQNNFRIFFKFNF